MKEKAKKVTKEQKARLQAEYDYACDMAKNPENIADVRELMQDSWKDMILVFDAKTVIGMVHPITILQNHDFLCEREKCIRAAHSYLKEVLSDPLTSEFKTILQYYTDELKEFGIDPDLYTDAFAKNYAKDYVCDLEGLPQFLSANIFLENIEIKDIYDSISWYYGFDDFLKEFIDAGGDETLLATKFLDEIGYSSVYEEFSALFDLLEAGCDIDVAYLADCVDVKILNNEDKNRYYQVLKEHGADKTILERFAA